MDYARNKAQVSEAPPEYRGEVVKLKVEEGVRDSAVVAPLAWN